MTTTRPRGRTVRWAGLAVVATVLLTACNAVPGFNPGVAARVDDDTISLNTVNDVSTAYCDYVVTQLQEGQALPQHLLRGQVAGNLALRSAADQFAADEGVTADPSYAAAVAQAEQGLADLPAAQRQAVIDVQGATTYVQAVEKSVGAKLGTDGGAEAQVAAGQKAFQEWLDDHDIAIDPRFSVSIDAGSAAPSDTSLSFPLGVTAKTANADQPDTEYAGALPEPQRCG